MKKHFQREADLIIPKWGDEFLLELPFTEQREAVAMANRILTELNSIKLG